MQLKGVFMLALDFHSVSTESVSLGFICPTCSYRICEVVFISEPNLDRGLLDGSHECDELNICCSNCGREFNTKLYSKRNNGLLRGFVEIEGACQGYRAGIFRVRACTRRVLSN